MSLFPAPERPELPPVVAAAIDELRESYEHALGEAYRKRDRIYGVTMDSATHDVLAEAFQLWRENELRGALFQSGDPAPPRDADGRAPALGAVFGHRLTIDDTVEGVAWDTGPEPNPIMRELFASFGEPQHMKPRTIEQLIETMKEIK